MIIQRDKVAQALRNILRPERVAAPADPWESLDLSHTLASGITVRVRNQSDWWVFNEVFVEKTYDAAIDLFMNRAESSVQGLILDLGANVGFFTARVIDRLVTTKAPAGADLILVEGSPTVYRELQNRLPDLVSELSSLSPLNALVGPRSGSGTISEVDFWGRNTVFPKHNAEISPISEMTRHRVVFVDLGAVVGPSRRVGLLKCDIEGSEQVFIENYKSDLLLRTDAAVFEFHHRLCDVPHCLQILSDSGLHVVSIVEQQDETSLVTLVRK